MLMVFRGGVGFHMVDIGERFGPDAVTFFYKVCEFHLQLLRDMQE